MAVMKKSLLTFCAILVFLLIFGQTVVSSQEPETVTETGPSETIEESEAVTTESFDAAYGKYQDEMEIYRSAHDEYLFKKAQYQRFGTLTSRQEAQSATVLMLETRDNVVISYLLALKTRVSEAIGVQDSTEEGLKVRIDEEIGWFTDHRNTIPSAGTLEDLEKDSIEAQSRWKSVDPLIYEVLAVIAHGRVLEFTDRTDEIFGRVKNKSEDIRTEERDEYTFSNQKFDILNRWVFETENRIARSKERKSDAESAITLLAKRRSNALSQYNEVITILGETQLYLKEANTFMGEIIREIKTAEE
ncbi:hypothetical protein A3F01_03330 [Candidatus Woesebacteria bacterium RIFCSPHIGHO2_12_FULL_38_11]|uniref:Uncharacterized protein n=1 Tax=Candidatus Woesebacteria bacterium RIFCSPLOWO2_01_FULL_39_25 TaxID=1802521 RepID=A0A1F8BLB7_9BACT|nr:MAG: hypothetical protein A3F01_03330 [Candidatus Woesebacteria bacterium RIFCSPHIGHO2_12_FULL_38_11]OGM64135.1 MAG: hypothetical protein A2893_03335 [Candidatus Woesebacteria bacterium RIFCSPLOWO2_01_FULL_39_25]